MLCKNCGELCSDTDNFCRRCGSNLRGRGLPALRYGTSLPALRPSVRLVLWRGVAAFVLGTALELAVRGLRDRLRKALEDKPGGEVSRVMPALKGLKEDEEVKPFSHPESGRGTVSETVVFWRRIIRY